MNNYFEGIRQETYLAKIFQSWLEDNYYRNTGIKIKTFIKKRENKQAHFDYLGRKYDINNTISELALEIRTLKTSSENIIEYNLGFIDFPICKLNEAMLFWRLGKEVYILYKLGDGRIYVLNWEYYLKHNFEVIEKKIKGDGKINKFYVRLPLRNFIEITKYKESVVENN